MKQRLILTELEQSNVAKKKLTSKFLINKMHRRH